MSPAEALGPVIANLAADAGITHVRLAVDAHMSRTTLQRRLAGDDQITAREIVRLATVLGIQPSQLWALADRRASAPSDTNGN